MKKGAGISMLVAVAIAAAGSLPAQGGVQIAKPAVMDSAVLSITASDFHGLVDGLGSVAAQVSPMMNATTLRSLMGMQLGDPMLTGIPAGKGMAIVAMDPTTAFAVIELTESQFAVYTNKLGSSGMRCHYDRGVLVVAKTDAALAKGVAATPAVRATLLTRRTPTLRVGLQPAAYLAANDAQVQGMLQTMTATMTKGMQAQAQAQGQQTPPPEGTVKILEGETRVLISLLKQVDAMEIVLTPADGSLQLDQVLQPVAGSRLAALVNAPRQNKWNPKVETGAAGSAAFMLDFLIENNAALSAFITAETEQLIKEMALESGDVQGLGAYMQKCMAICKGSVSESILGGTAPGMNMEYVMEVTDGKAALDLLRTMSADLKATGFLDFYEGMGMPMSFEFTENVRQYKGVAIHQLRTRISMDRMPAMQREQMETMNLTDMKYEAAVLDGLLVYAMGASRIESIIDRIKGAAPRGAALVARTSFPAGGFYYGDTDLGRYMEFVAGMMPKMPGNPMPFDKIGLTLQGAPPITSAAHNSGGRVKWSLQIPADLLARIGQAVMAIQMQQMQQQMNAPAPTQ